MVKSDGSKYCLNVEKGYEDDYWSELTFFSSKYLGQFIRVKKVSSYKQRYDYKLTWSVSKYMLKQDYSEEAYKNRKQTNYAVHLGGLLGYLASEIEIANENNSSMSYKSIGDLSIVLEDVTLFDNKENIVKSLGVQKLELKDKELVADADCLCAYFNMDYYFKQLMRDLAPKIEATIIEDLK